ncbi:unnamed protein product [Ilex paraguariensis]|uniref:Uncharacterized protein n=1 Tax=Ilex paraguariensis TaxID=185542 RepID=A0ABC8TLK1_9AQUA
MWVINYSTLEQLRDGEEANLLGENGNGGQANSSLKEVRDREVVNILLENGNGGQADGLNPIMVSKQSELHNHEGSWVLAQPPVGEGFDIGLDAKGHWTRTRVAKVSLLICPFWFLGQLTLIFL